MSGGTPEGCPRSDDLFLVSDCCLHFSLEFGCHFPNPMLLGMFHGVLQNFLFSVPTNDMLASGRRINLGTFDHFTHDGISFV